MPSRRHVLAALGTVIGAGCTSQDTPATATSTTDTTTTAKTTTSPETTTATETTTTSTTRPPVSFDAITATRSFVYLFSSAHHRAYTSPDTTFVFARADRQVDRTEYDLVAGDRHYPAQREVAGESVGGLVDGVPEGKGSLLAFAIEGVVAPADATINGPDGATALPESARQTLRTPPKLSVSSFSVPSEAESGSDVTVTISVENRGGVTGAFRANVGSTALSGRPVMTVDVPAESTRTVEKSVSLYESGDTETVRCDWGADRIERTIELTG